MRRRPIMFDAIFTVRRGIHRWCAEQIRTRTDVNTAQRAKIRLDWKTGVAATVRIEPLIARLHDASHCLVGCAAQSCTEFGGKCCSAAQDWDAIAKKDNLNEMSMELRRLEAMVKEIHEEMLFLRTREEEMRDLNGEPAGWWSEP